MMDAVVAELAGITPADLDDLLQGKVHGSVATRLNVPLGDISTYINQGRCGGRIADRLGFNMAAAERLGSVLGREGRIGLTVGLLLGGRS